MTQEKKTKSIPDFSKDDFIPSGIIDGHEYVDLGLPSGIKWATYNIGASSPEESGDYFAWGETDPKASYGIDSYRFAYYAGKNAYGEPNYDINSYPDEDWTVWKEELEPEISIIL